jgi:phage terminase large subunit
VAVLDILIPYRPRPLQLAIHEGLTQHRFGAAVCHRRFGKTVLAVNHLQRAAVTCLRTRPRFAYLAPTYSQGKSISWEYMKHYAAPIPGVRVHESELRIDYPACQGNGGAQVRIYGADNPDSLRGLYFDGVVLDEYGLMRPTLFSEVIRPALSDREGWAFFIGTPNGKNQFYDVIQKARSSDDWFFAEHKASETHLIPDAELAAARQVMTDDEYAQEYECSFEASVKGAVFAREIQAAREAGRITRVPYDPTLRVCTTWDLGVGDATSIWFTQHAPSGEVRVIDFYEATGQGLPHYVQMLQDRRYVYDTHWAPFDIEVRDFGSGHSRKEVAANLGVHFQVVPRLQTEKAREVHEGIHAARMLMAKCWFDAEKTKAGLEALKHYHWDYNTRINELTDTPVHDWASHAADAFRYLGVWHHAPTVRATKTVEKPYKDDYYDELRRLNTKRPQSVRRGGY